MFGKLFILVLVAVSVQSSVHEDVEDSTTLIIDTGDLAIRKLRLLIVRASMDAWQNVNKEMNNTVNKNIVENKQKVTNQNRELLDQIKKLKEEAENQKIDIITCLKKEDDLKVALKEFYEIFAVCEKDLHAKFGAASSDEVKAIQEAFQVLKKLEAELKACDKDVESEKCKTKVEAEITRADSEMPAKIHNAVDAIIPVIQKLIPTSEQCVTDKTNALITKEQKTAQEIEACINSKIHEKR